MINANVIRTTIKYVPKLTKVEDYMNYIEDGYVLTLEDVCRILDTDIQIVQRRMIHGNMIKCIAIEPEFRVQILEKLSLIGFNQEKYRRTKLLVQDSSLYDFIKNNVLFLEKYIALDFYLEIDDTLEKLIGAAAITDTNIRNFIKSKVKEFNQNYIRENPRKLVDKEIMDIIKNGLNSRKTIKKENRLKHDTQLSRYLYSICYSKYSLLEHNVKIQEEELNESKFDFTEENEILETRIQFVESAYYYIKRTASAENISFNSYLEQMLRSMIREYLESLVINK